MRHRIYPSTCTITKHPSLQTHCLYKEVQSSNPIITPPPRLDTETSTPTPQTHPKPSQSHALPTTSPIPVKKKKKSPSAETRGFQPSRPPSCGRKKASAPLVQPGEVGDGTRTRTYLYDLGGPGILYIAFALLLRTEHFPLPFHPFYLPCSTKVSGHDSFSGREDFSRTCCL